MAEDETKRTESTGPATGAAAMQRQEEQRRRLAEALRENLQKRKQQARLRDTPKP